MNEIIAKSILSANNGMNIYRGCTHGCIYCDSRSECYGMRDIFEDISVKVNSLQLLEKALLSKRKKCMIGTGSMSDPYMHIENQLQYTRNALKLIYKYGFGGTIITKSDLVLRDLDLIKKINNDTKFVVQMTMTTFDEKLCSILEPNVCTTKKRFEALKIFNENGIDTIVWLTPILPYINDTTENILGILDYCKKANVKGIITFGIGLTLRNGSREYYYQNLDKYFPGLKETYMKRYRHDYGIGSPNSKILNKIVKDFCKQNKMLYGEKEIFSYLSEFPTKNEQLSLFNIL